VLARCGVGVTQIGITVDWHTYPKQSHITSDVEFRDIEKWLVATRERTNEKERYVCTSLLGQVPAVWIVERLPRPHGLGVRSECDCAQTSCFVPCSNLRSLCNRSGLCLSL
jgi:hypothetical protein